MEIIVNHVTRMKGKSRIYVADVQTAFGADLVTIRRRKLAVPAGRGSRSLAVVPLVDAELRIDFGKRG